MDKIKFIEIGYRLNIEDLIPFEDIPGEIKQILSDRKQINLILSNNKDKKEVQEFGDKVIAKLTVKFEYLKEKLETFLKAKLLTNED